MPVNSEIFRIYRHLFYGSPLKKAVEERTQRTTGKSLKDYTTDLRKYIIGWFNFYKLAQFKGWAREIDQWIRRRIRMIYWKRWKKIRTKYETLKKRGIDKQKAWEWANTSKKPDFGSFKALKIVGCPAPHFF